LSRLPCRFRSASFEPSMRRTVALALLAAASLAGTASDAAERPPYNRRTGLVEPGLAGLRKAAERGDRAEMGRWAERIGPARLARALTEPDRDVVLAVLDSLPTLAARLLLADAVLPLCHSSDAEIAGRAIGALGALLAEADPARLLEWDVPGESSRRACQSLAGIAEREAAAVELRLAALQALGDAGAVCAHPINLPALLRSPSAEIRRAALLALRPRDDAALAALRAGERDADPLVAAAAGAALCRARLTPGRTATGAPAERPLREIALAAGTPIEDAAEMVPCLTGSGDAADARAAEELAGRMPALKIAKHGR
jgi:hypothetical protein